MTKNSSGLGLDTVGDLSDFLDASAQVLRVNH